VSRRSDLTGRPARRRKRELLATAPPVCVVCGGAIDTDLSGNHPDGPTVEHLVPVSVAPELANVRANQALSHRRCNTKRGNRSLAEVRPKKQDATSVSWT
jgi:5-methylcytosine-specific restriction endonuclease McrA